MITSAEALRRLERETGPSGTIEVPVERARGRVLAETVVADRDYPPTDRAAMDGFAVRAADVRDAGTVLEVAGEIRAGRAVGRLEVGAGQAVRIMTGAVMPPGADAVVKVEHTFDRDGGRRVRIDDDPVPGQHVRPRGIERRKGGAVMEPGTPIHAAEIAGLASVGRAAVRVYRRPEVHVLTTGDEIVEPDRVPGEHQVRNSSSRSLLAQLAELHVEGRFLGVARDSRDELGGALERGLEGDLLLITGGVSAGKYDLVGEALAAAGMRTLFHRVSVKPGKPLLAGRRGDCLVMGLPGNPVSTFTSFAVFVAPVLRRMLGYPRWRNLTGIATLTEPLRARSTRETYHLARIEPGAEGLTARRVSSAGSGDVLSLTRANGFIVTPIGGASYAAGAAVPTLAFPDPDHR